MNRLNNLGRIIISAVAALVVFGMTGCEETIGSETMPDETVVTLRLDEAFQEKAYIRLNHDGSQDDFWCYLVTQDMQTGAETLMKAHVEGALESTGEIEGNTGTNKNITVNNLEAKTSYRVIAARILPDGSITGNVAELVFTTLRNPDVFEVHPTWEIAYDGRRTASDDLNQESEVFDCSVGGGYGYICTMSSLKE